MSKLLEQIIKNVLVEQLDTKHVVIKPMSKSKRQLVVAAGGVTGFEVIIKFRGEQPNVSTIISNIKTYIQADVRVGENSDYDIFDDISNSPRYMYVIGDDIAKSNRRIKLNVWIIAISPLDYLADKIDELDNNNDRYQKQIDSLREFFIGDNISVFRAADAKKWIAILKLQATNLDLELFDSQLKRKVMFPDFSTINKQELDDPDIETGIVKIDSTNQKEYNTTFTGTAEVSYDSYGNKKLTYVNGYLPRVYRITDKMPATYTGEFIDGMPSNGKVVYNDGETWEGEITSTAVRNEAGKIVSFQFIKTKNTKVSNLKIKYPYTKGKNIVYTMSDSDPQVYVKVNDQWFATKKSEFELSLNGGPEPAPITIPKTNTDVYNKLDALIK